MSEAREIVQSLAVAMGGDIVWVFDSQASRYEGGKYLGRGVWKQEPITEETRVSFIVRHAKFDRKTGTERPKNGFTSGYSIYGADDREARVWLDGSWSIGDAVRRCKNADILKQVAALVGWEPKP